MKVKFHGESDPLTFIDGKVYDVIGIEDGWYRIIDETGEDYLYYPDPDQLEVIDEGADE